MPETKRQPRVQFRLEETTYELLEARAREAEVSPDAYARVLFLQAFGQSSLETLTDELTVAAHAAKRRMMQAVNALLEKHMDTLLEAALGSGSEPSSGTEDRDDPNS